MIYRIKKDILWRMVDDEVVIVSGKNDNSCYLNRTGSEVWQMVTDGLSFEEICRRLAKYYNMKKTEIEKDIKNIIDDLLSSKILEKPD